MVKIIAEIGWNHGGDMDLAKHMIAEAASCGASYAKFQTWSVLRLKPGPWDTDGRKEIYEMAELSKQNHIDLMYCCALNGINFLSSVFSQPDAELLLELGCKEVKIPSFESRNHKLIKFCGENFDTVYMSTGTSALEEIVESKKFFGSANWCLLHCVSMYPCRYMDANLPKMLALKTIHNYVGYSDHIMGIESAKIAIGAGAQVIEKHFTTDNNLPGRDNKFAITPKELVQLRQYLYRMEDMTIGLGTRYSDGEIDARNSYTGRFNG